MPLNPNHPSIHPNAVHESYITILRFTQISLSSAELSKCHNRGTNHQLWNTTRSKYPVLDWVKPSLVIFDIRTLWRSECPDVKNYKWRLNPVWHRMCVRMLSLLRIILLAAPVSCLNARRLHFNWCSRVESSCGRGTHSAVLIVFTFQCKND